ncbi:MAG: DNA-processing protein DprA [Patescibacteria group bacterium]
MADKSKTAIKIIKKSDAEYPRLFKEIPLPPEIIYLKGSLEALNENLIKVAIVGTRRATGYGRETAKSISRDLSLAGVSVVSGLALGIDSEAHRGALEGPSPTIAVLGSGVNKIYPATNQTLAQKIIESGGAVISEFPPDYPPDRWTFPQRNRIIAGLSRATIVIEAPEKSGALITARLALDFNRDVGAVPGEISSINSKGTNFLLKSGGAVIRSAEDIFELLGMPAKTPALDNLDENEEHLLGLLAEPASRDWLAQKSGLEIKELNQKLTMLELYGKIKNIGGTFHKL